MGTGLAFLNEGRAAKMAIALAEAGYGVRWYPDNTPHVVMTSATFEQVRKISNRTKGLILDWHRVEIIDVGGAAAPEKSDDGSE